MTVGIANGQIERTLEYAMHVDTLISGRSSRP
jgi:hypothetical protein